MLVDIYFTESPCPHRRCRRASLGSPGRRRWTADLGCVGLSSGGGGGGGPPAGSFSSAGDCAGVLRCVGLLDVLIVGRGATAPAKGFGNALPRDCAACVQFGRWKRLEAMEVVAWSVFFVVFVPFFFERFFVLRHCVSRQPQQYILCSSVLLRGVLRFGVRG